LTQDYKSDFATGKVLLIAEVAVCCNQYLKSRRFGDGEKFAVFQLSPPARAGLGHGVMVD
jgi:hypothetical protein